ncbi:chromodomain-helicase-DNA-binding protein 7 [Caerostris extrusa]|uniref:Chromodomain-helicase-DNA-binding protein 7 n=1 Tax=Caerostris extrusa TaxID=172846 RepID=A0AAV4RCW2_CAEEX|nr:chromodomain-helicase-DNA-binding protein 7 [Caerostris extrusa]
MIKSSPEKAKEESEAMDTQENIDTSNNIECSTPEINEDTDKNVNISEIEAMEVDNIADSSGELKIDEDPKAEDEETDIETDLRKEEEDVKEVTPDLEKDEETSAASKIKTLQPSSPTLEDNEKDDQKYDCDTDTESKCNFESVQIIENEESPLVKMERAIKSEKSENELDKMLPKVKQEEIICEDGLREKYNMGKLFTKDDLHSHVDDSQMITFLQGMYVSK